MNAQLNENHALEQAKSQVESIVEMVAALNCDYDRLEELTEDRASLQQDIDFADEPETDAAAKLALIWWDTENAEELAALVADAGECDSQDDAQQRIQENPLSVQVRSDWHLPSDKDNKASEFEIMLCTGGPAVRIIGDLDEYGQPGRAHIQYQDWGTPWTDYVGHGHTDDLLTYCQQFYFGE